MPSKEEEENRRVLYTQFGTPTNSWKLGLDSRNSYTSKDWKSYRNKPSVYRVVFTNEKGEHTYERGHVRFTSGKPDTFWSVLEVHDGWTRELSLKNVNTIRYINDDLTTSIMFTKQKSSQA